MAIYKIPVIVLFLRRYKPASLTPTRRFDETRTSPFVDRLEHKLTNSHISMAKNDDISQDIGGSSELGSFSESKLPLPSPAPKPRIPVWVRWFGGSILSLLLSLWMPKWTTILRIGGEAEVVLKEVEQVAEMVEKVATVAEKVAEEVEEEFPDQSRLKEAAAVVEKVSKEASKDAHAAEEIIHKVDAVTADLEDLETLTESLIHKISHDKINKS